MGKYLKLFEQHAQYETYINSQDAVLPNVSYCIDNDEVHYNPYVHDYSKDYLTTIALEDGTISFNIWKSMGTDMITSISYSTDNGETWTTTQNQDNKEEHLVIAVDVNEGDKVLWKGDAQQTGFYDEGDYGDVVGSFFSSTCEFNAEGNVMSLLYGDDFIGEDTLEYDGQFGYLFSDYDEENECNIVNAKSLSLPATTLRNACYISMFNGCTSLTTAPELPATTLAQTCYNNMFSGCTSLTTAPELPATTLTDYCYQSMFGGCTSLTTAPELPATTLASGCYINMFSGCTSLVTAPELPATTLASDCYSGMFDGCTSLVTAPELPATTLTDYCYYGMFGGCTSLTTAPELPATTLTDYCYQSMFSGCTSLTTAPELPATTLASGCYISMFNGCTGLVTAPELPATTLATYCYYDMFNGCTSLVTAPELPATTLASSCYISMFYGCTSLVTAPELPATTLTDNCYGSMFYGCTNLNYIKAMFTTKPSATYTSNWVYNVASTGTFVKNSAATWNVTGNNGIPSGWTVVTE